MLEKNSEVEAPMLPMVRKEALFLRKKVRKGEEIRKNSGYYYSFYKRLFKDKTEVAIFFLAFLVEIAFGYYLVYRWGFTFTEGDAIAHLYIARTVVDNGPYSNFTNLGTVWLPMFHLLVIPLVLIDPLYTSGFAGTIVNALATGGICVILYRLIGEKRLGILASALFLCNAFTLIYGAAAMTEQTTLFFMTLAAYYFKSYWEKDDVTEFMKCSLALSLGTLTRYDVWPVAPFAIVLFSLRELKNKQWRRLGYAHLPIWGIVAWLFWNLAIFRDPLMFYHHPATHLARVYESKPKFVGSIELTTNHVFQELFGVSGILYLFVPLSLILLLIRKKPAQIMPVILLISPMFFQWYLMFTNTSAGIIRYFYVVFPGLVVLSFLFAREFKKKLKAIVIIAIFVTYLPIYSFQANILATGKGIDPGDPDDKFFYTSLIFEEREDLMPIKRVIGRESNILASAEYYGSASFSVFLGISPSLIIDDYDGPFYIEVMEKPWKYVSIVVVPKGHSDDPLVYLYNSLYEGKYYVYHYYYDEAWKFEFLRHYNLVLETKDWLIYQINE